MDADNFMKIQVFMTGSVLMASLYRQVEIDTITITKGDMTIQKGDIKCIDNQCCNFLSLLIMFVY